MMPPHGSMELNDEVPLLEAWMEPTTRYKKEEGGHGDLNGPLRYLAKVQSLLIDTIISCEAQVIYGLDF
jgi:hypothetical protein